MNQNIQQAPQQNMQQQMMQPNINYDPKTSKPKKNNIEKNWNLNYTSVALSTAIVLLILGLGGLSGWLYYTQTKAVNNLVIEETATKQQRNLTEKVRDAWEKQASLNDGMVTLQERVLGETKTYQTELLKHFRVLDNKPQVNPGQAIDGFRASEDKLYNILSDIDIQIEKNAREKQKIKDEIDTLYKNAEIEQSRRLNINDGLR
jgi:hypothetical protein